MYEPTTSPILTHRAISSRITRIMAAGDSNTVGAGSPGGYRLPLYRILSARGFLFDMVGSQSDGPPELPDKAHEAYGGYSIDNLHAIIADKLMLNPPDVVLLMIGSQDASISLDMSHAPARLGRLLDTILTAPSVRRIILSTIPPFDLDWPTGNQAIMDYNAAMPGLVSARTRVTLVDLHPQINIATDFSDGVHLNANGEAKLAALFADAITGVGPMRSMGNNSSFAYSNRLSLLNS